MARIQEAFQFVHLQIQITLNEDNYQWHDPRVYKSFEFSLPVGMLDTKKLAEVIQTQVEALQPALVAEKVRYEAEEKAKAEAERVKAEANV